MSLELREVTLRDGADVHIHPTTLALAPQGFNTLLGETLAGKTTLLRLMAGLVKPSAGSVWFGGRDVTGVPVQQRRVSMVYQQFINYPNFSVFDNIASPLRVVGSAASEIKTRVGRIAELLKLSPLLDRKPAELSGGQQQRVAIARAIVTNPDTLFADEPTGNLDSRTTRGIMELLQKLNSERNISIIMVTHEDEVAACARRVIRVMDGLIADDFARPAASSPTRLQN
jgi:glycerol transport system ATP-binding protein